MREKVREKVRESVSERGCEKERDKQGEGERDKQGEGEWTTVTRVKARRREDVSTRVDPGQRYDDTRRGQHHKHQHVNWRDRKDITTFYFTRFPDQTSEKELWAQFKQWGEVREVFISKKRNKAGRRYGFVRFKGVQDERRLERDLDNIIFGGLKMYVNAPRYGRGKERHCEHRITKRTTAAEDTNGREVPGQAVRQHRTTPMTYAKAVASTATTAGQWRSMQNTIRTADTSHSSVQLEIPRGVRQRYTDAWVGRLKEPRFFKALRKSCRGRLE